MSRHKAWGNNLHRGSTAIIAPNLSPKLVRKAHVIFLLQLPCMATQAQQETIEIKADAGSTESSNDHNLNTLMEEGEIDSDKEESTSKEEGVLEKQFELWPILVDAVVQFNRIAFHHYSTHNLLVDAYTSTTNACYALNPSAGMEKPQVWAKLDFLSLEKSTNLCSIEDIIDTLPIKPEKSETKKDAFAASELAKPIYSSNPILLQMVKSNDEPWFDDGFGKDIRVLFYEMLQKNSTMLESLESGRMEPIKITLLKVFLGEDLRMGDIEDEMVGPWLCFSVKYINVDSVWQGLTDFTMSYLRLNLAIFHGLPFKSKKDDTPAEGLALAIFGGGCTHPALPCNSASIELQHFNEEDTRLSQLDCTCSHQACILNIIDSRSRALEAALFEGYIFAFKPLAKARTELADGMADDETPARLYSHVLRVTKGKIYLFCLRQVEQLLPKAPAPKEASNSFAEYFRLNIIKPSIIKGGKDELTGFSLLNPLNSHTTLGNTISSSTGMASHHSRIPALPSVAAETCWLSQILSKSMGDGLYQEKVLCSARIQSIKKLFMSESEASISMFNKHMDELCPLSQERLAYNSDSLSIIHQQMLLNGLSELIKLWPQVYPNANLKQFLRDVQLSIKNRLNSLPFEMRNICTPLVRPVPPPPPAGLNLPFLHGPHRPPGLNHSFPKHMMPPPFPAPGFRPLPVSHWSSNAPRESAQLSSQGYLKPDPYAGESKQCQAEWQSKLGDPSNLLYQYWMARKEDNITLQPNSKRQNNDFDSRVLPKD